MSGSYTLSWAVQDLNGNSADSYIIAASGNQATYTFTKPSIDIFRLCVQAVDSVGGHGYDYAVVHQADVSPDMLYGVLPSSAEYIIESDGQGWY